jgi:hypothetical protein
MLPEEMLKQINNTPHVAIAEIAGRNSIAAVIQACDI